MADYKTQGSTYDAAAYISKSVNHSRAPGTIPGLSGLRSRNVPSHGPGLTRGRPGPFFMITTIPGMTGNSSQPVDNTRLGVRITIQFYDKHNILTFASSDIFLSYSSSLP